MKNRGMRFFTALIICGAMIYFSLQIYSFFFKELETFTVLEYVMEDSYSVDGILTRNEVLVSKTNDDFYEAVVKSGEKIIKGDQVALSFSETLGSIKDVKTLNDIENRISQYENAQTSNGTFSTELSKIEREIDNYVFNISNSGVSGDLNSFYSDENNLNVNVYKKQIVTGQKKNFDSEIISLKEEKEKFDFSSQQYSKKIYAPVSGYYISAIDNLESTFTTDYVENLSLDEFNKILNTAVNIDYNSAGKIIKDFHWCFTFPVKNEIIDEKISIGKKIDIRFSFSDEVQENLEVINIVKKDDNISLITVTGDNYLYDLNINRTVKADIIFEDYKGLRIPSKAIRVIDGKKGVYCLIGARIKFKEIDVAFTKDDFSIINSDRINSSDLLLYDEVIVRGKDIYDGKIIQ